MSHTPAAPALVLTAGLATRFQPLSFVRAKAAAPVAGLTLIERLLRWLAAQGVGQAVLNLHHRPETITREVGDGSHLKVSVRYSWEPSLLGSAGGPRRALPLLDADRFFLVNGDTLTDASLHDLALEHTRSGALVTMALVENPDPSRYGGVQVDPEGWIVGFNRPGSHAPGYHFIGVQVVESRAFTALPLDRPAETVGHVYPDLIAADRRAVRAFICRAAFADVGTPAGYLATCLAVAAREGHPAVPSGRHCQVHPTSRLIRTVLWDGVVVEPGCELVDCVVADGARLPAGSRFERAVIVPDGGGRPGPDPRAPGLLVVDLDDPAMAGPASGAAS